MRTKSRRTALPPGNSPVSRLPRPSVPDKVKIAVAIRQLEGYGAAAIERTEKSQRHYLERLLLALAEFMQCPRDQLQLDHEPALENRIKVRYRGQITRYRPDANEPNWLSWRPHGPQYERSHLIKTNVRGDNGQHSDRALAAKNKNIVKNRDPRRRKVKIPQRKNPWPKGRKLRY